MMFKEIHECIGYLRYEITAKPKRIAFVIYQREASYWKIRKKETNHVIALHACFLVDC